MQLTTNRLSECVAVAVSSTDCAKYLALHGLSFMQTRKRPRLPGKEIAQFAPGRGNMAFVRDVARLLAFYTFDEETKAVASAIATIRRKRGESGGA